ncbi:uncharacterized protein N7484_005115 [Penicillium longicatenatum]|uniref:uncharacterized protein n=1 Tax=Penicillium longicatenatum TaxID=1561947 RepID=UPI002547D86B|nr:uncharacterized protein N7484_005115 [Penicillium longicatenatum]KAJ5651392.1 hypothetical protein N7484_005115 [Penicillium longicatenatum]
MPPLSAYTPFESLLFFQSLATSDVRPASFASISSLLSDNPLVRENVAFSADRLSPEALEDLYSTLLRDGFDRDTTKGSNGVPAESPNAINSKKRKISSPRPEGLSDGVTHAVRVPELVSHLYARYRELVTKEIRESEREYDAIQDQIQRIKKEEEKPPAPAEATTVATPPVAKPERPEPMDVDVKQETPRRERPGPIAIPPAATAFGKATAKLPNKAPVPAQNSKEGQPPPAQPSGKPIAPVPQSQLPPSAVQAAPNALPSPIAPRTQVAPTTPAPTQRPTAAHPSQVAPRPITVKPGVPDIASTPQSTPAQSSFQQWQLDPPPKSPYSAISPTTTPQVNSTAAKQPLPPPAIPASQHRPSVPTIPSTPGPSTSAAQTPVPIGRPHISQTPGVVIPSFSESRSSRPRLSIDTPGSSTPWKRTPRLSIPDSPASPVRPLPEDVSPISERAPSPDGMEMSPPRGKKTRRGQAADQKPSATPKTEKPSSTRKRRAVSSASTQSRGRSVASRGRSPLQTDDAERDVRSSKRQKGTTTSAEETPKARSKRKRGASESAEQESAPPEAIKFDSSRYVMCARGFHRTAGTILNDVTTHKLASIFAKPLGERDAPGYHDLIYRPQDLKTIKSAVHQGSKAVATATEAVSTPAGDSESPAPVAGASSKNNALMLPKTEDLLPPKGIVNSGQLEKEFIRMFSNAIMFNPVPERDFGPHFPMINDRGSRESSQSGDGDEGGIIQDSREMFEDVEQAVIRWRAAERASERASEELAHKNLLALRRPSVSDMNTDSADDAKG